MPFLEGCFKVGLLDYWSAVSVHPYSRVDPESTDFRVLRSYAAPSLSTPPPANASPSIPANGLFGLAERLNPDRQGQFLARQYLNNSIE